MQKILILLILISFNADASWLETYREMVNPIWSTHTWYNESNIDQIPHSRDLNELQINYGNENMYNIYHNVSDEFIMESNKSLNQIMKDELQSTPAKISKGKARRVFRALEKERVVKNQKRYDPKEVLGLCFGRAIIADMHARARGLGNNSIKKVWVLGDMKKWQFHVATILKTTSGWYAIDNYTGMLRLDRWKRYMRKDRKRGARPLMFFVTDAARFGFMSNHIYSPMLLFNYSEEEIDNYVENYQEKRNEDFYKGFFVDFFIDFDRKKKNIRPF